MCADYVHENINCEIPFTALYPLYSTTLLRCFEISVKLSRCFATEIFCESVPYTVLGALIFSHFIQNTVEMEIQTIISKMSRYVM